MKVSYKLKRVCGSVYNNGNIIFTRDGNSVLSPVGNQVSKYNKANIVKQIIYLLFISYEIR